MRRVLEILLVQLLLLGCAFGSEEQTNAKVLVIDVFSVKASGVTEQKGFALWARDLREGKASLTTASYRFGAGCHIGDSDFNPIQNQR